MLDSHTITYTVLALVPNLFVILFAMARMNRQMRLIAAELAAVKRDMQLVDQGVKQVTEMLAGTRPSSSPAEVV